MNATAVVLALLAAQAKVDRVVLRSGAPKEGTVQTDTWKEVVVSSGSRLEKVKAEDVLRVEYYDAPPTFRAAMDAVEQEKWSEVLTTLSSAEELFNSKDKNVVKPRSSWFPWYLAYWRGYAQLRLGKSEEAIRQFEKIRRDFKDCRFLLQACELSLQALRERKDDKAMDAFEKEIHAAPSPIREALQLRARRQRAELLFDKGQFGEARGLFEELVLSADPEIATDASGRVIGCLLGLKDAGAIDSYCKKILSTATQPGLLLIASNALGEAAFEKGLFAQARAHYVDSVVRYNPGRTGSGAEREHERALHQLARCYEALMAAAKDGAKTDYQRMAASTYRELSTEYPSGRYGSQAGTKAIQLEPKEEKAPKKK